MLVNMKNKINKMTYLTMFAQIKKLRASMND